ncbi:MAG: hypothetical protein ABSB37_16265 [Xanthobacteraceae bacterium]
MRASKGDLRLSAFSMHGDDDLTFAPLMFVLVKAAAALGILERFVDLRQAPNESKKLLIARSL